MEVQNVLLFLMSLLMLSLVLVFEFLSLRCPWFLFSFLHDLSKNFSQKFKISATNLRFDGMFEFKHHWSAYLSHVLNYGNPQQIQKIFENRIEFKDDETSEETKSELENISYSMKNLL